MFQMFSAALSVLFLIANTNSAENAAALELLVNLIFRIELYKMFQYPDPQPDPCNFTLLIVLCILTLLSEKSAVRWLK